MRMALLVPGLLFVLNTGCVAVDAVVAPSDAPSARRYAALAVGNRWEYRVTPAQQGTEREVVEILSRDDKGFFVDNRGARLAPRTDGLFDGQRFLLQEPVKVGHAWIAIPEPNTVERFTIRAVGVTVRVPAGSYADCVEVEGSQDMRHPQTGAPVRMTMTWSYAPHVGLVKAVGRMAAAGRAPVVTSTIELLSFHAGSSDGEAASSG